MTEEEIKSLDERIKSNALLGTIDKFGCLPTSLFIISVIGIIAMLAKCTM